MQLHFKEVEKSNCVNAGSNRNFKVKEDASPPHEEGGGGLF